MYKYLQAFEAYVAECGQENKCPHVDSLLKMLCCCYHQQGGVDSETVRAHYDALYASAGELFPGKGSRVVEDTTKLCAALQDQAF